MNTIQKLNFLKDTEHLVSPNYKGYNYLLIMLMIDNVKYSVVLDRRKLSYHKNQLDVTNLNIIKLNMNINISDSFYDGTIFNGKLVISNNSHTFFLQDCFYLMGKDYLNINLNTKLEEMEKISNSFKNNYCKNFDVKLNKIYYYDELDNLINNIIPNSSLPVNGLIFYPNISGINILFLDKKAETLSENSNKIHIIDNNKSFNNLLNNNQINNEPLDFSKEKSKTTLDKQGLSNEPFEKQSFSNEQTIINDYVL